ncbi:MAG: HAD-IA family hydrolase [Spirochaetales bacterium]|nr:HAD-IA family hydrolase [Spirochaetales bacterium]
MNNNAIVGKDTKVFLFDMGNVVVKGIGISRKIANRLGVPHDQFELDYHHWIYPLMEGEVTPGQYWHHAEKVFGRRIEEDLLAVCFTPYLNDEVADTIGRLRNLGYRVVCASNTYASHWEILREMGVLSLFDALYPSHEMGLTKPSHAYFRHILEAEGIGADEAYFVDDSIEHVESARSLGIPALHYSGEDASCELQRVFEPLLG